MFPYENKTLSDISNDGSNYMYSLISDYDYYVQSFGYISVPEFIQKWNCMNRKDFQQLKPGDIFYTPNGDMYEAIDYAYESDDEQYLNVECVRKGTNEEPEVLSSGDVYIAPIVHDDIRWKKRIQRKEVEKLCPILISSITKTNQHQN